MGELLERLTHASDGVVLATAAILLVALYFAFTGLHRVRRIEDVPTAKVRSAAQGYVELVGTAHALDGEPIIAPLSRISCCWFSYRIDRRSGKHWRPVDSGVSDGIFLLRDDSGDCVIDPEGAEVTTRHKKSWSDDGDGSGGHAVHMRLPALGGVADTVVDVGGKVLETMGAGIGEYRYSESVILPGDPLYAIGQFHTLGSSDQSSSLKDLTGAILREWKRQPDTLRERFDANRDGIVDLAEWDKARAVAEREALQHHAETLRRAPLHTLKRPADRRYFLLSNLEQFGLLRRYRWRTRLGFSAAVLLGSALVVMLSSRL